MPDFTWPELPDSVTDKEDYSLQNPLVRQWTDAFEGWEFDLPGVTRCKVVSSQSFYSEWAGGVQLYTYIWALDEWLSYAKGTPSELRRNARNFKCMEED